MLRRQEAKFGVEVRGAARVARRRRVLDDPMRTIVRIEAGGEGA